jgi:hypothetical protein
VNDFLSEADLSGGSSNAVDFSYNPNFDFQSNIAMSRQFHQPYNGPIFEGIDCNKSPVLFLREYVNYTSSQGVDPSLVFKRDMSVALKEDASNWWHYSGQYQSWKQFCSLFVDTFNNPQNDAIIEEEISGRFQYDGENLYRYMNALETMFSSLSYNTPENVKLKRILFNMHPRYKRQMQDCRFKSVNELAEFSVVAERKLQNETRWQKPRPNDDWSNPKFGFQEDAYAQERRPQHNLPEPQWHTEFSDFPDKQNGFNNKNSFNCGEFAHFSRDCSQRETAPLFPKHPAPEIDSRPHQPDRSKINISARVIEPEDTKNLSPPAAATLAAEHFNAFEQLAFNSIPEPQNSIQIINDVEDEKNTICIIDDDKIDKSEIPKILPAPLIKIEIAGRLFSGMLDSGSCASVANHTVFQYASKKGVKITPAHQRFGLAQGIAESNKHMTVDIKFEGNLNEFKQKFYNLNEMPQDLILGRDFLHKAKMQISIVDSGYYCGQTETKHFPFASNPKCFHRRKKSENLFHESMHLLQFTQIPPDDFDKTQKFGTYADDSLILLESLQKHANHLKLVLQELMKFNFEASYARRKKSKLLFPPPKVRKKVPPKMIPGKAICKKSGENQVYKPT